MNFSLFVDSWLQKGKKWKNYWFLPSKFFFYRFFTFIKAEIDIALTKTQASAIWNKAVTVSRCSSTKFLFSVDCTRSVASQICKSKTMISWMHQVFYTSLATAAHFLIPIVATPAWHCIPCASDTALELVH